MIRILPKARQALWCEASFDVARSDGAIESPQRTKELRMIAYQCYHDVRGTAIAGHRDIEIGDVAGDVGYYGRQIGAPVGVGAVVEKNPHRFVEFTDAVVVADDPQLCPKGNLEEALGNLGVGAS